MARLMTLRLNGTQLFLLLCGLILFRVYYRGFAEGGQGNAQPHANHEVTEAEKGVKQSMKHVLRKDGLLEVNMAGKHPLRGLIKEAERKWEEMNARQSRTFHDAVTEYVRRNGYPPPAGFDSWWKFTQKHNVRLVDEFDQINYDITPYLALSPRMFRERVDAISDPTKAFHVNITDGHVTVHGPQHWYGDQKQLGSIIGGFSRSLPDLTMHGHGQRRGDLWIGEDLRRAANAKARVGEYFTEDELRHFESIQRNLHKDLKNVCMPDDPVFNMSQPSGAPMFVTSHLTYISPCSSPSILRTPPLLFMPNARQLRLTPHFVFSKHRPDSGFLLPTNTWEAYDPLLVSPHVWSQRNIPDAHKLFWRGSITGWNWFKGLASPESGITWRDGVRAKLALSMSDKLEHGQLVEVLFENNEFGGGLVTNIYDRKWLNVKWMDVGMTGSPIQCHEGDGTCDAMQKAPMWKGKYPVHKENRRKFSVDVDSNEWSTEFQRKLGYGHVVFKSTTLPEWNTQWLIPYYHYIPIQSDYSDVYNIMAFFLGDPDTGVGENEELAEMISCHASDFVRKYWRWQDMQAYMYRLTLEYIRLGSEDRQAASFSL